MTSCRQCSRHRRAFCQRPYGGVNLTTVTETGAERNVPANIGTQAVVHIGDGVTLTRTGAEFDPTLPFEQWLALGEKICKLEGAVLWWWGDWLLYGEKRYPDRYSQALEATDYSYQTLRNAAWVAGQFPVSSRLDTVPWSFHQEVAKQAPEVAQVLLHTAEAEGWTQRELREAVRAYKRNISSQAAAFPDGTYRIIYADPPWLYTGEQHTHTAQETVLASHYPSMPTEDICALPVGALAAENAVLFLWATSPKLPEALQVIDAWGFTYKGSIIWDKVKHNVGHYVSVRHEFLLIATRGSCLPDVPELRDSVVSIERTEHSVKPDYFREWIDHIYPHGPRIELFARTKPEGWEVWGNECN